MTWLRKHMGRIFLHIIIWLILVMLLYPLAMALWNAFKSDLTYEYSQWYPTLPLRVRNIATAWDSLWRYVLNTVIVGVIGVSGCLLITALASYSFARIQFPGRKFFYAAVMVLLMIPGVITLVPSYMLYRSLGLLNSYAVLIFPVMIGGTVFGVFLLTSFFQSLPKDVFEAAQVDGAGDIRCFYKIAVPMCMPILGTLAIMQLVGVWNDYLWPMITIQDPDLLTISSGLLVQFTGQYFTNMPVTFAGYLVSSVPLILLFIFANKSFVEGLVNSAIKL